MIITSPYKPIPSVPEVNVAQFLVSREDQDAWPEYTMYIEAATGKRMKLKQMRERIHRAATALDFVFKQDAKGDGANAQEIVGVFGQNQIDYVTVVLALLHITTPFSLLSTYSTPFELNHALKLTKVTSLIVEPRLLPLALRCAKECGIPKKRIFVFGPDLKGHKGLSTMIDATNPKEIIPAKPATRDTLAYLVFSSGTSGLPKAVMISHGNLMHAIFQSVTAGQAAAEIKPPPKPETPEGVPVALSFLPMYHSYGLNYYCFRTFLAPLTVIIMKKWNTRQAIKLIAEHRVTILTFVPSIVHQLVNSPEFKTADFSSVQTAGSGAAHLPPTLSSKLSENLKINISEGYGQSEATISSLLRPIPGLFGRDDHHPHSTGVLLPSMKARIVREDGTLCGVNEPGELWVSGGNVALGYFHNEKATRETFVTLEDGERWLRTGDMFRLGEDGMTFFFEDRAKDTLKVGGAQVSPVEIEKVLMAQPDKLISDVTVAGVSGGRTSDEKVPRAWIVLSETGRKRGAKEVIHTLEAWYQENLSKYKWLRGGIEVVKEIPKSPTGKVLRRLLQDNYEKRRAGKPAKAKL